MSSTHKMQDATGVITRVQPDGDMDVVKRVAPTDGQPGFGIGCFWRNMAGTPGGIFYVNIGTITSANWLNIC